MTRVNLLLLAAAAVASIGASLATWLVRDPMPWFAARYRGMVSAVAGEVTRTGGAVTQSVRVTDASGLAVDLTWRRPREDGGARLPIAVIVGGHLRGADAVHLVGETPGVIVAAISYPYDGEPRPSQLEFLAQLPAIRRGFLDTPPALRLALDYLTQLPDVDTTRVELVGVSLGAPFVTVAGALDERVSRVWAVHGSGGWYSPLATTMKRTIGPAILRKPAAFVAGLIIAGPRMAPDRWVARISPRKFVQVSAEDDETLPRESVVSLYDAAREPKEMIWMSGGHIHGDAPTIAAIVDIVMARIRQPATPARPPG